MYIDETFVKKRILELRILKGKSARDMSLSIGQNENYINEIENGKMFPSVKGLIYICEYFEISLQDFFDVKNNNPKVIDEIVDEIKSLNSHQLTNILVLIKSLKYPK